MKKILFTVLITYFSSSAFSQKYWTLDSCISHGLQNSILIKQAQLQKASAEIILSSAKTAFLPDLNGGVGQNWNFGRTQSKSGLYENIAQSNTGFNLSSSLIVFAGGRLINSLKKAKLDLQVSSFELERMQNSIILQTTSLFFNVLLKKEIQRVAEEQFKNIQRQAEITKILVEKGKASKSLIFEIKAQIANDTLAIVQASNEVKLALLELAQLLEIDNVEAFDIVAEETYIFDINDKLNQTPEEIYLKALTKLPEIKLAETLLHSSEQSLKLAKSSLFPTLSLQAGVGSSYFYLYNSGKNTMLKEQLPQNLGQYISLSLTIPIFNRMSDINNIKQSKISLENQRLALQETQKKLFKDIQTIYTNAVAIKKKYIYTLKSLSYAQEAFNYSKMQYESGKITAYEFSQSKNQLSKSLYEEIQVRYTLLLQIKFLDFYLVSP